MLLSANGVRDPEFPEKYAIMGERNEEEYEESLREDSKTLSYLREDSITPVEVGPNIEVRGRRDFVTERQGIDYKIIHECKSTDSKSAFNARKQKPKTSHMAQLVHYMVVEGTSYGKLQTGLYKWEDVEALSGLQRVDEFIWKVRILESGSITVNGSRYAYNVHDLLHHRALAAKCIEKNLVWDRPENWDSQWGSPCNFCFAKEVCKRYDAGEIKSGEEFIQEASKLIGEE